MTFILFTIVGFLVFFQSLLTDEQLANVPVLILGNKIDKPGAASEDELRNFFGLYGQTTGKVRAPVVLSVVTVVLKYTFITLTVYLPGKYTAIGDTRTSIRIVYVQCSQTTRIRWRLQVASSVYLTNLYGIESADTSHVKLVRRHQFTFVVSLSSSSSFFVCQIIPYSCIIPTDPLNVQRWHRALRLRRPNSQNPIFSFTT